MDQGTEVLSPNKNIELMESGRTISVTDANMPWLKPGENKEVNLLTAVKKGQSVDAGIFFLGELVGKRLTTSKMEKDTRLIKVTDKMFQAHIPAMVENQSIPVKRIMNPRSDIPIYYFQSSDYTVYFQRHKSLEGLPVFVKIAACGRNEQRQVLSQITNESKEFTKSALR